MSQPVDCEPYNASYSEAGDRRHIRIELAAPYSETGRVGVWDEPPGFKTPSPGYTASRHPSELGVKRNPVWDVLGWRSPWLAHASPD
jgi:hypothetical protein